MSVSSIKYTDALASIEKPRLSVIIATCNRAAPLAATIDALLDQSLNNFELWVIDQSDPDQAGRVIRYVEEKNDPRLGYLHLAVKNLPNARNEGLSRARGEIVLFVDDDILLISKQFLAAHLAAYHDPKIGAVVGRHIERSLRMNSKYTACHVSWTGRTIFNLFGTERMPIRSCKGSNMSYRAAVVDQVQGFDRKMTFLEDTDFSTRVATAGWKIMFEPDAEIVHLSIPTGGVRQSSGPETEYGRFRGTAYFILKHRGVVGAIPFVATFTLIALIRAWRYRSPHLISGFFNAMRQGFILARRGPDQAMPVKVE